MATSTEQWVSISDAASQVGYVAGYVWQLVNEGKVAARRTTRTWCVNIESVRQYADQAKVASENARICRRIARWLLSDKTLWNKRQPELRVLATAALGFEVTTDAMYDAIAMSKIPRPKTKLAVTEQWIMARPYVLEETKTDAYRIWGDEMGVCWDTFVRAARNVTVTLENERND